jgi:signal peptide peptidase SppA
LKQAFDQKRLKAVALNINSPGGSPVQSELIFQEIRHYAKEKKVPVYTFAQDVAASGGYFLLIAGDEIYAHNASIIGSIGVISANFGFVEAIKKLGIERRIYTQGKNKALLDPFSPEDKNSIEIIKEIQQDIYQSFIDLVKERRGKKIKLKDDEIFTGAVFSGKKSQEIGLIDEIGDLRSVMTKKFGKKIDFKPISAKKSFLKSIFSSSILIDKITSKIEEKFHWSKFGL